MATGTVKWFNPEKGYGFITPDGGGKVVRRHKHRFRNRGFFPSQMARLSKAGEGLGETAARYSLDRRRESGGPSYLSRQFQYYEEMRALNMRGRKPDGG